MRDLHRVLSMLIVVLAAGPAVAQPGSTGSPTTPGSPATPGTPGGSGATDSPLRQDITTFDWAGLLHDIWSAELFHLAGTPIRLNQIVIAVLVVVVGVWVARRLSGRIEHRLRKHRRIDPNVAAMVQKLVFYVMALVALFIALPIAGIPMTIFTVLGSAVAIGIGFGAQNLVNNLIGGFTLLIERPIRLGDIVELADQQGRVESIGNRCVRIRRFDGVDVMVPNASVLQNPLINWTLTDADVRGRVAVGVAYGSDVALVRDLISRAADEDHRILRTPPPEVLFADFGDNALMFEVYFWASVTRPLDLRRIESDLRFKLDKLLAAARVVIAYPQRDLHLDTTRPLEIRLQTADAAASSADAEPTPAPRLSTDGAES